MDNRDISTFLKISVLIRMYNKLCKTNLKVIEYSEKDIKLLAECYSFLRLDNNLNNSCYKCGKCARIFNINSNKYYCWYHSYIDKNVIEE